MASPLASRLMFKHLRLIAAIAQHGQLSLAAQALSITQPAASRTLTETEALIGAPLFERHPKGMTLTAVGDGLARHARNIIEELNEAADEVDQLRLGRGGTVRIGAVTGAAVGYVLPAVRRLKALAPQVDLHIQVATSDELIGDLMMQRLDMVLGRLPVSAKLSDFQTQRASGEQVLIVANAAHPAVGRADLSLADLTGHEWVMQGPGAPIRRAVEEALAALNAPLPRNITNTASLLVVIAMLRDPNAVTPISREVADLLTGTQSSLVVLPIRESIAVAPYSLITLKARRLSPIAARCRDLLSEVVLGR